MKLYVIRHKASGKLMPLMKRNRGYTSWNPSIRILPIETDVPRIISGYHKARRIAKIWAREPNLKYSYSYNGSTGEEDYELDIKPDGRKLEDIELVLVVLNFSKSRVEI